MKNHIALVLPPCLPVPAVQGGAIETLVTLLADINESEQRVFFDIFCIKDRAAELMAQKYKYSKIYYMEQDKNRLWDRGKRFARRVYRKVLNKKALTQQYYIDVLKKCKEIQPDYIVAEGGSYREFGKFSSYFGKNKMVLHIHHHLLFSKNLAGIFGTTLSVSQFINNAWKESCDGIKTEKNQKNLVVVNAVDEALFQKEVTNSERNSLRAKYGITEDDILLLYLGRVIKEKGVLELVNAVVKIKNPHIKLLVVGNSDFAVPKESKYLNLIKKMIVDHADRMRYESYVDNQLVYLYAKSADIRVFPAQGEEAISLALLESILCYTPLIITRSGGMPEAVCEDGAEIIEKGEFLTEHLTESIKSLVNDREKLKKMKIANQEHAKTINKLKFYYDFINAFGEYNNG